MNIVKIIKVVSAITIGMGMEQAFAYSDPKIPNGKVLGYTLKGCFSHDSGRDYCKKSNEKELQKVLNAAKELKEPNFDKNKKAVQLFYKGGKDTGNIQISDTFIIDEKAKTIYLHPLYASFETSLKDNAKKAPTIITKKSSEWFCLHQEGALFRESYIGGSVSSYAEASPSMGVLSCVRFKRNTFESPTTIIGGFDETKEFD